jgi:predicted RNA binding protein YcfA (HicA-like mRNA interferase family)
MSKNEKLLQRLKSHPVDFTWDELLRLLKGFGYQLVKKGKTGGSRRRFIHPQNAFICLHEPHPQKVLKKYQIDQIIEMLMEEGLL